MRARIIFRGLVLFEFEKPRSTEDGPQNRGTLTAWLIGHADGMEPSMEQMHAHRPRIGVIARDATTDREFIDNGLAVPSGETRIQLIGHDQLANGVVASEGFDNHVPRLASLCRGKPNGKRTLESCPSIVIPHGEIRPRDYVSWDADGNPASAVAFMGTAFHGFVANEAVVNIGDDEREGGKDGNTRSDPDRCLAIQSATWKYPDLLSPLCINGDFQDETDPNTVEILVTNFSPQRRRAVFWSLHYQWLFDALGYARNNDYTNTDQFSSFVSVANNYDRAQWQDDYRAMSVGHPFPYIITDDIEPEKPFEEGGKRQIKKRPPLPAGRGPEMRHTPMAMHKISEQPAGAGTDPWARPICPLGQVE